MALYEAGETTCIHVKTERVVVAETNLCPLMTVTLDDPMLDPTEVRHLGFESAA